MRLNRPIVIAGVVAGSIALSLGLGMTIANAATSPSTTTPPASSSKPPTSAPGQPMNGGCPNMGSNTSTSGSASSNV